MDILEIIETSSFFLCSISIFLWMSIGSLSRTTRSEVFAQRIIALMCITSALLLFSLHYLGGEIWGSDNIARPLAIIAVIVALSSVMNIKGKEIQKEANPHTIMKARRDEK